VAVVGVAASGSSGNVIQAASASATDVNTAITSASNGDTVLLPLNSSATWSIAVSLPSTKYITLDLNGCTITLSGASGEFTINSHASGLNRITNGTIIKAGQDYADYNGPFVIADTRSGYGVRVDHIDFQKTSTTLAKGTIIDMNGQGAGVMDNCTFSSGFGWADEFIHINGWGAGVTTGWTTDSGATLAGSGIIFYIEDCAFTGDGGPSGVAWIQSYYGARICYRYNTFDWVSVDAHGTPGNVGTRWWECYENTFDNNTSSGQPDWAFSMRAGSGVIYNNHMDATAQQDVNFGLCEEDSGYPAAYQIGRGLNQASDPAYVWDNDAGMTLEPDAGDAPEVAGMVELDRDVYASARPGYSTYTYPHPLRV
jgi:hypothetical protein